MSEPALRRILVIGGIHGREPLGPNLVRKLQDEPLDGVEAVIGNPAAVERNTRFVAQDLNRVFPGDPQGQHEVQRAAELMELGKGFDLILDFHNTKAPDNDCGLVGPDADSSLYAVAGRLGLTRIIVASYDCINKYLPRCLSVEISIDSPLNDADHWYRQIQGLLTGPTDGNDPIVSTYRYMRGVSLTEKADLALGHWENFQVLPAKDAAALRVPTDTYVAFADSGLVRDRYAALLEPVSS